MKRLTSYFGVGAKIKVCTCICISLEYLLYLFKLTLSTVILASNTDSYILAEKNKRKSDLRAVGDRACFVRVKCKVYSRESRRFWARTHRKRNFIKSGSEGFLVRYSHLGQSLMMQHVMV